LQLLLLYDGELKMPRIDDLKIQEKVFKKTDYRSWDGNLLEKLKLTDDVNPPSPQEIKPKDRETTVKREKQKVGKNKASKASTNRVQLGFMVDRAVVQKLISKLEGNEKKIFFHAINICSIKGLLSTGEIIGEELNKTISTTRNGRETAIKRLSKKGLLKRNKGKTGVNGTLCLYVNELIKSEALNYLSTHASEQAFLPNLEPVQEGGYNGTLLGFNSAICGSKTTNKNNSTTDLSNMQSEIDLIPLAEIGFTENHLEQIFNQCDYSVEMVQESIYHFAFDLEYNNKAKKIKTSPLSFFMGILKKHGPYVAPENYESPQDKAMRIYIEQQKAQREKRETLEKELMKLSFDNWFNTLSEEDISQLLPEDLRSSHLKSPKTAALRQHFEKEIWGAEKNKLLRNITKTETQTP